MCAKILVPVDGSQGSDKAVQVAIDQAKCSKAEIRLLYVLETPGVFYSPGYSYKQLIEETEAWGQSTLDEVKAQCLDAGIECVTTYVEHGHPAEVIVSKAGEWQVDLIVMGSHGRRGLNRILMGSVTSEVLSVSHIPILVVPMKDSVKSG